jgi:hypothetical protein
MCGMAPRLFTLLTGRNVPQIIRDYAEPQCLIINEKTVADFTRVVEAMGILDRQQSTRGPVRDQD